MAGRKQQKATSENKVYEIGDASGKAADRVTVTGNISDFKTGEPMVGVAVFVKDPMIGATTDAYGYYTLRRRNSFRYGTAGIPCRSTCHAGYVLLLPDGFVRTHPASSILFRSNERCSAK